jgi:hypothetical protein
VSGLTKSDEVGEIITLYRLKSLSPQLQSDIKVAPFLANNLRFTVKLIDKTIVINGKIHKNKRKRFYSSNKEGLIC